MGVSVSYMDEQIIYTDMCAALGPTPISYSFQVDMYCSRDCQLQLNGK